MSSLKNCREEFLISRTELARQAGLSVLTIDRIEKGENCRQLTKGKIIRALLDLSKADKIPLKFRITT